VANRGAAVIELFDLTTVEDTARFTARIATDPAELSGVHYVSGARTSFNAIIAETEAITGTTLTPHCRRQRRGPAPDHRRRRRPVVGGAGGVLPVDVDRGAVPEHRQRPLPRRAPHRPARLPRRRHPDPVALLIHHRQSGNGRIDHVEPPVQDDQPLARAGVSFLLLVLLFFAS
jgi:hypothetical protein